LLEPMSSTMCQREVRERVCCHRIGSSRQLSPRIPRFKLER
jgi:hypothetical protein